MSLCYSELPGSPSPGYVSCHSLLIVAPQCHLPARPWPAAVLQQVQPKTGLADDPLLVHGQHWRFDTPSRKLGTTHALQQEQPQQQQ